MDWEKAEHEITKAIDLEPEKAEHYLERGRIYHAWKLLGDAERDLRHSIRIRSTPEGLHLLGVILVEKGEPKRAIPVLEMALTESKDPDLRTQISSDLERAKKALE